MFNWIKRLKLSKVARLEIAEGWRTLRTMQTKVQEQDPQEVFAYAEGVRKVAGLLAHRFELSIGDVLLGWGLDLTQLTDASNDLVAAACKADSILAGGEPSQRNAALGYSFGCLLLHHLYRLRFLSECAPANQQTGAEELAGHYAQFASWMSRTFVDMHLGRTENNRDPSTEVNSPSGNARPTFLARAMTDLNSEGLGAFTAPGPTKRVAAGHDARLNQRPRAPAEA